MSTLRTKSQVLYELRQGGIVPVIRADSSAIAVKIAEALVAGGITTLEITMTVPDAFAVIRLEPWRLRVLPGSLKAGAEFLVTPCAVPEVLSVARERDVAVLPGAMTPTEVFTAWSAGGDIIKIFPAGNVGGASYLKALKGPFPQIPLCPTGGVTLQTIGDFVKAGADAVGVGGELVSKAAIERGDFAQLTILATQYLDALRAARG